MLDNKACCPMGKGGLIRQAARLCKASKASKAKADLEKVSISILATLLEGAVSVCISNALQKGTALLAGFSSILLAPGGLCPGS